MIMYGHPYIYKVKLRWQGNTVFQKRSYCKSYYFRYSHVLYRITILEKSERFDSLPHDLIQTRLHRWHFLISIQIFFGQAVSQNSSKPLIVKGFYFLRMSNGYCFRRAVQGKLSQRNRRNTATVLRAVVKSHNRLKGTKVFACGCSGRNLKSFSKFAGKSPCWGLLL